ncbi:MAG: protein translocase subunit SecD [Acidimicrobiales bacterium]
MKRGMVASVVLTCIVCFGAFAGVVAAKWKPLLGLDLKGGLSVVYCPAAKGSTTKCAAGKAVSKEKLNTVVSILSNRVNALGVSQPNIGVQGSDVVVQLPGIKNASAVEKTLGNTAQLYFRPVLCFAPPYSAKGTKATAKTAYVTPPACPSSFRPTATSNQTFTPLSSYKTTPVALDDPKKVVLLESSSGIRYELGPSQADGSIIAGANAVDQSSGWAIAFTLTSKGTPIFDHMADQNYQKLLADDLGGVVISAPSINATGAQFGNQGQVTGSFTQQSASTLAIDLNYGALPVTLVKVTTEIVSPSLGASSLHAGLLAGLLGLVLVMLYTIFYYRALGVVVVLGLVTTAALLYAIISALGHTSAGLTLDLSGITGLIVSVGITVDSYVVYFERLKDEVRAGRSIRASVDRGFKSAYRTILSADAVSFIGALVLWWLSVGAVRGFAFMLGLSTLIDVATAYCFTRPLVILLGRNRIFTEARGLGIARGLAAASPEAAT